MCYMCGTRREGNWGRRITCRHVVTYGNHSVQAGVACDGWGNCVPNSSDDCGYFKCSDRVCARTCTSDPECIVGAHCTAQGTCVPKANNGAACASEAECATGSCIDGICCESPCDGQCEACNVPALSGTPDGVCRAITGSPRGGREACTATGTDCGGSCDGTATKKCAYPNAVKACGASSCANGTEYKAHCDGKGACGAPVGNACVKFACGETAYKSSCAADSDCAPEFKCDVAKKDCVPSSAQCDGEHTLVASGGLSTDCAPYRCTPANACLGQCSSRADCINGMTCTSGGRCEVAVPLSPIGVDVAPPACGMGRGGPSGRGKLIVAFATAVLAIVRRRASERASGRCSATPREGSPRSPRTRRAATIGRAPRGPCTLQCARATHRRP